MGRAFVVVVGFRVCDLQAPLAVLRRAVPPRVPPPARRPPAAQIPGLFDRFTAMGDQVRRKESELVQPEGVKATGLTGAPAPWVEETRWKEAARQFDGGDSSPSGGDSSDEDQT